MVDRIVMASRRNDGTINETDPVYIGPKDDAVDGAEHQLLFQAIGGAQVAGTDVPDTDFRSAAEAEVEKLHVSKHLDKVDASPEELGGEDGGRDRTLVSVPADEPLKGVTPQPASEIGQDPAPQ